MIILTCGHQVESLDDAVNITHKAETKYGVKAVSYSVVCTTCKQVYQNENLLFESDTDAYIWLFNNEEY